MKVWETIKSAIIGLKQHSLLLVITALLLGGMIFQSKLHDQRVDQLEKVFDARVQIYKEEFSNIKTAGDELFKVYVREKAEAELQQRLLQRQEQLIQQLLKKLNEYEKWQNIDPDKIT